jgi:hypothetical protein
MLSTPSGNAIVRNGQPASGVSLSSSHGAPEKHGMVTTVGSVLLPALGMASAVRVVAMTFLLDPGPPGGGWCVHPDPEGALPR